MPTQDISRHLHQPEKHYASVRMQQGRVILDSDWNERASLEAEDLRRTIRDLACAKGTPNAGMQIAAFDAETFDFQITNGSYYLGGMRLVVDAADGWETYLTQTDWLQVDAADGSSIVAAVGDRIDLVYVLAWEQPVCAIEDSELREVALGGRDTSVRMRRMRRFEVLTVAEDTNPPTFDSADAFAELVANLESSNGTFDPATHEWASNGRLRVGVVPENQSSEDPCTSPEVEGYVGAENRAIRVELRPGNKLTWGYDNASPLYRVKVGPLDTLTFLTLPADLASMPRAGQVVEVHRWGSKLPNVEKVAEAQGQLFKVTTTYDPTTQQLVLDGDVPTAWVDWLGAHGVHYNPDDDDDDQQYFYLRVWDRGADTAAAELDYILDTALPLGDTGLSVTLTAHGIPGDHWIIAARPTTPDKFVPWDLDDATGVPPHGPHRYVAPLALIRWTAGVPTLEDARTRLRTLCEGGCCQVTVGDGKESHGMVSSLQDAIDLLADTGGKICVLPGVHEGLASLDGLTDILIEGCGPRTILTNPRPEIPRSEALEFYTPVLSIIDCERITIKDLRIEAFSAAGIEAKISAEETTCARLTIENVEFHALGNVQPDKPGPEVLEPPHSGLAVYGVTGLDVFDCRFTAALVPGLSCPLELGATAARVHRCSVDVGLDVDGRYPTPGGIRVRSGSRDVEIVGCRIEGGWGHGIALGHAFVHKRLEGITITHPNDNQKPMGDAESFDGCTPDPDPAGPLITLEIGYVWLPAGPVEDLRIHDNVIRGMGFSGISTCFFFPAAFDYDLDEQPDGVSRFIVAAEIDIARNLIEDNVRNGRLNPLGFQNFDVAVGGIVLAASVNAWIHENTIRNNGSGGFTTPICGVGMIAAQNAVIEDNRIVDNGKKHPGGPFLLRGLRGGIAIWEATTVRATAEGQPTFPTTIENVLLPGTSRSYAGASPESAVIVRGNEVSQPLGKALWVRRGFGAITVTGNSLEGFGEPVQGTQLVGVSFCWKSGDGAIPLPARGICVEIIDFGISPEVTWAGTEPFETPIWCDVEAPVVSGGALSFGSNTCSLDWTRQGGDGVACLLSSNDCVTAVSNTVRVAMHNTFVPGNPSMGMSELYADVMTQHDQMSFLFAGMYLGASGTAQASDNRIIESKFDSLFSILVGSPASPVASAFSEINLAAMITSNICSHLTLAVAEPFVLNSEVGLNTSLHTDESPPLAGYVVESLPGPFTLVICVVAS